MRLELKNFRSNEYVKTEILKRLSLQDKIGRRHASGLPLSALLVQLMHSLSAFLLITTLRSLLNEFVPYTARQNDCRSIFNDKNELLFKYNSELNECDISRISTILE